MVQVIFIISKNFWVNRELSSLISFRVEQTHTHKSHRTMTVTIAKVLPMSTTRHTAFYRNTFSSLVVSLSAHTHWVDCHPQYACFGVCVYACVWCLWLYPLKAMVVCVKMFGLYVDEHLCLSLGHFRWWMLKGRHLHSRPSQWLSTENHIFPV